MSALSPLTDVGRRIHVPGHASPNAFLWACEKEGYRKLGATEPEFRTGFSSRGWLVAAAGEVTPARVPNLGCRANALSAQP